MTYPSLVALFILAESLGPLLYFTVRALTEPDFTIRGKMNWHLLPMVLSLLASLQWLHSISDTDWQTRVHIATPSR